ncbi:MAG: thermostable hemolysin [Pseudohongiellaceae bacterium]
MTHAPAIKIEELPDGLIIAVSGDARFEEARLFVKAQYKQHFSCDLDEFFPEIFCLYDQGQLLACCGFRSAANEPLFLEQYLDEPVEHAVSHQVNYKVARGALVELGGFAVANKSVALAFMAQLAPTLYQSNFQYVSCTVTAPVRRCLTKLGIQFYALGQADPQKLKVNSGSWGTYYNLKPSVVVGAIHPVVQRLFPEIHRGA